MAKQPKLTTVLDVSKALGFGYLYHPVIGQKPSSRYPYPVPLLKKSFYRKILVNLSPKC